MRKDHHTRMTTTPPGETDYPYIRAWCDYMLMDPDHRDRSLQQARELKAPHTACYYRGKETGWLLVTDIVNPTTIAWFKHHGYLNAEGQPNA